MSLGKQLIGCLPFNLDLKQNKNKNNNNNSMQNDKMQVSSIQFDNPKYSTLYQLNYE